MSGITHAMHHRLSGVSTYRLMAKERDPFAYAPAKGYGTIYLFIEMRC